MEEVNTIISIHKKEVNTIRNTCINKVLSSVFITEEGKIIRSTCIHYHKANTVRIIHNGRGILMKIIKMS